MSAVIRYRYGGVVNVPFSVQDAVDNIGADATDDEIMREVLEHSADWGDRSPSTRTILNCDEVIASVRAEIERRAAEGGES